jgi:hypothetical protein
VDRVLDVGREIDRPRRADSDAGRNVGWQNAGRGDQPDREIAGDLGDGTVLRIDFDKALGADICLRRRFGNRKPRGAAAFGMPRPRGWSE